MVFILDFLSMHHGCTSPDGKATAAAQEGDETLHVLYRKPVIANPGSNIAFAVADVAYESPFCGSPRTSSIGAWYLGSNLSSSPGTISGSGLRVPVASQNRHGSLGSRSSVDSHISAHLLQRPLSISFCRMSASARLSRAPRP